MSNYHLSDRMAAVAGLVPAGVTACDIGCDHGFVAIHLVEAGVCPGMIAMDINKGPLLRAKEHIESAGLSTYIDTRLSDGLEAFEAGEAECMIAAGMGGRLIVKILSDYPEKVKSLRYLVLQPQSELSFVGTWICAEISAGERAYDPERGYGAGGREVLSDDACGDRDLRRGKRKES